MLFKPQGGGGELFPCVDKVVHLSLFAALAASAFWRFGSGPLVLAVVAAYAPVSELVQAYALPDRSGDPLDVLADLAGVALARLAVGWGLGVSGGR